MCGLAAVYAYGAQSPPVRRAEIIAMGESMAARGPDGAGEWLADDGRIGFAHRRLAIIDLSAAAAQPMTHGEGRYRITYNGEIYNFRALRKDLEDDGAVFRTESDTEVILHLYERHGAGLVERLRGMYAFALWDEERRGLLLARDPFGIKPLYYADDGRTIRAASQVKALVAGGGAGTGVDPAGHAGFFLFGYVPEPHTLYEDIRALPAGSTLWVDGGGPQAVRRFFDASQVLADTEASAQRPPLGDLLRDSVDHHLVADVRVGVFLSAGLDSATLTGLAAEHRGGDLDTFTLGFDEFAGTDRDEVSLAEAVAQTYGTRHVTRRVAGGDFASRLDGLLAAMDQPSIDGVNTYFVADAAARSGLKVALSGLGGDELFGGYDSFRQIPALVGALGRVPGAAAAGRVLRPVSAPWLAHMTSPKYAGLLEYGADYGGAYMLRRGLFMPWELPGLLGPDLARAGWEALAPTVRLDATHRAIGEPRRKVAALETVWYMANQLLRDADWAGMAHSLEIRVPLVDAALFRGLAPWIGRPGGPDKQAMARTPDTPLPDAVLDRPKTGFFVPVREWLQGDGNSERGLRGWARRVYRGATGSAVG